MSLKGLFGKMVLGILDKVFASTEYTDEEEIVDNRTYRGMRVGDLDRLAKSISSDASATLDEDGRPVFTWKSRSGKTTFVASGDSLPADEDGDIAYAGPRYSGQWRTSADKFAQAVNEAGQFYEEHGSSPFED